MLKNLNKGFRLGIVFFAAAALIFLAIAVVNIFGAIRANNEAQEYQSAGGCRGGISTGQTSPCHQENVVVLGKSQRVLTTRHQPWHIYTLNLRRSDGSTASESQVQEDLWQSVAIGAPVSATVWRGKVTELSANGYTSDTSDEPSTASLMAFAAVGPWGLCVIFCLTMMRLLKTIGTS